MGNLTEALMEELNCETVFTIPALGGIPVAESVVVTWIIMGLFLIFSLLATRKLKVEDPGAFQSGLEGVIIWLDGLIGGVAGEETKPYLPYLEFVLIYIGIANVIGIFGFKPPTKDLTVTIALSLMSIILIQISGIRAKGTGGWIKSFKEPVSIMLPINILELVIKPLSLCMRLFGNVLGAFVIMELIKLVVPVAVPAIFSLYFDIFDGLIQAYVFVFLTTLFINEAVE